MSRVGCVIAGCITMLVLASCGSANTSEQGESSASTADTSSTSADATTTISTDDPDDSPASTSTTTTATTAPTTTTTAAPPLTWERDDLTAVGRVVQDGETALTVTRGDGGLEIVAVETTSGVEKWRAPYSMGGRFPGMGLGGFDISGTTAAHMDGSLTNPRSTELVGRDLGTGEELWRIEAPFGFGAEGCGEVFCGAWLNGARGRYEVRGIDPATGETIWQLDGGDIDYVTDPDLAIVLEPGDEPLIYAVEPTTGDLLWTVNPEDALGEDMTSGAGWNFRRENGVIMAVLGRYVGEDAFTVTFGLDESTGELLWRHNDTRLTRWRIDAFALASFSETEEWLSHDTLAHLDPATGEIDTFADLPDDDGVASSVVFASDVGYGPDGSTVYWEDEDGWAGVDVRTGEPAPTPNVLWTSELGVEELADLMPGAERNAWLRGARFRAINPKTGNPDTGNPETGDLVSVDPADIPSFVGPTISGWTVWIDADGTLQGIETR